MKITQKQKAFADYYIELGNAAEAYKKAYSCKNNGTETADIVSKLSDIVSHKTLLSQLEFIENVDTELEEINKEKTNKNVDSNTKLER